MNVQCNHNRIVQSWLYTVVMTLQCVSSRAIVLILKSMQDQSWNAGRSVKFRTQSLPVRESQAVLQCDAQWLMRVSKLTGSILTCSQAYADATSDIMLQFGCETSWLHCQNLIPQDQRLLSEDHPLGWSLHYPTTGFGWILQRIDAWKMSAAPGILDADARCAAMLAGLARAESQI